MGLEERRRKIKALGRGRRRRRLIVKFYEEGIATKHSKIKRQYNVFSAREMFSRYTKQEAAQIAYELNHWQWNTDLLGDYQGVDLALEMSEIFRAYASEYEVFKYECRQINHMTEQETHEAIIEKIFNNIQKL